MQRMRLRRIADLYVRCHRTMCADVDIILARIEFERFNQLLTSAGMSFVESSRELVPASDFAGKHSPERLYILGTLNSTHRSKRCTLVYGPNYCTIVIKTGRGAKVTEEVKRAFAEHVIRVFPP